MTNKSYLVSLFFAIAAHGALIFVAPDSIFRASLAVQSGSEALSIVLINHQAKTNTQQPAKARHDLAPHVQPNITQTNIIQKVVTKSEVARVLAKNTVTPETNKTKITAVVQTAFSKITEQSQPTKPENTPITSTSISSNKKLKSNSKHMLIVQAHENKGVVSQAVPQSNHRPSYPRRAILRNQQGKVEVSLLVNEQGLATQPALIKSSGYSLLDKSVLQFVEDETFIPATQNGFAIASAQVFRFRFELN